MVSSAEGRRRLAIALLLMAHVAGYAVILALPQQRDWESVVASIVGAGQISLLGIWVGIGASRWYLRLGAAVVLESVPQFARMIAAGGGPLPDASSLWRLATLMMTTTVPIVAIAAPLWVMRIRYRRLVRFATQAHPAGFELQFSIRHMLFWTAVLAVLLAMAHVFRPLATMQGLVLRSPPSGSGASFPVTFIAVVGVTLVALFMVPALLAVWACLGVGKPASRLLVAFLAMLTIGTLFAYYFGGGVGEGALWGGTAALELLIIGGSLLVFRSLGYRRVPHRSVIPENPEPFDQPETEPH